MTLRATVNRKAAKKAGKHETGGKGGKTKKAKQILTVMGGCFRNVLKIIIFRVVLCNNPKDVHVLWVWSEAALSPKSVFPPPLS